MNNKELKKKYIKPLLENYIEKTKDDWNYITPYDFYHKYYTPFGLL